MGAWNYTVPPDASTETCDWPRFLGTAPKIPFNAEQFFQWRKWKAYGSGVAGDLFVHLFSGTHFITGSHGPTRGMATGALRFWKDGRDVPDVMLGLFDYPEGFNLSLRVNFVDGGEESEGLIFTGSEGTMEIGGNAVTVSRVPRENGPGYTINTFTEATQKQIIAEYEAKYPPHSAAHLWAEPRSSPPPRATATATTTSTTSSIQCAPASPSSKMQSSATAPPEPPCSAI
jgi:predicted dehydrogenase